MAFIIAAEGRGPLNPHPLQHCGGQAGVQQFVVGADSDLRG